MLNELLKTFDVAVVGAGAAGLMAAIFSGRAGARTIAIDAAPSIGKKILISGGGRCNVTHDVVTAADFNGSRNAIAKVLRTFDVPQTVAFFEELGVRLKREETGKLFPVSDRARDIVDALLRAARDAGVTIVTGQRITANSQLPTASRVVLAAGGQSVPKTGSDGSGYALARAFGHTVTKTFPGLVPLVVERDHWITTLSGTSVEAELSVKSPTGRVLHRERGSMLFTHFGISGPVVLDISRHWIACSGGLQPADGRLKPAATLAANFLPGETFESVDAALIESPSFLRRRLPDRLAERLSPAGKLTKEQRRRVAHDVVDFTIPVVRDRGFDYAEVTAGGVPLSEVDVTTMRSRVRENLYLCGEILDVDGKIGGYNFQWAWASGRLAGLSAGSLSAREST